MLARLLQMLPNFDLNSLEWRKNTFKQVQLIQGQLHLTCGMLWVTIQLQGSPMSTPTCSRGRAAFLCCHTGPNLELHCDRPRVWPCPHLWQQVPKRIGDGGLQGHPLGPTMHLVAQGFPPNSYLPSLSWDFAQVSLCTAVWLPALTSCLLKLLE